MLLPADAHAQGRRTPSHGGGGGGGGRVSGGAVRSGGGPVVASRGGVYARPYYYRSYYRPYFYDPFFWGSYGWGWGWGVGAGYSYGWGPYGYGYPYGGYGEYGYGGYGYGGYRGYSEARIEVTPKEAKVYVDGYYAGIVDDFDGWAQRLDVPPGEHEVEIYQEGYHTKRERVLFRPGKTVNIKGELAKLGPGQPPEAAPQPVPPPPGQYQQQPQQRRPRGMNTPYGPDGPGSDGNGGTVQADPPQPPPPPSNGPAPYGRGRRAPQYQARATDPSEFGTLSIRVQPHDAVITVDGERWETPDSQSGFSIQMGPGRHHVEVKKDGFRPFTADVQIESGELTPLNVSLLQAREN
jgi:hypothetical protein